MKILKTHVVSILNISSYICILLIIIVIVIKQSNQGKSIDALKSEINTYKSANSALIKSVDNYTQELYQLNQTLTITQQYVEDWKSYTEGLSTQIIRVPEYHEQTIIKEVEVDKPVYINNQWREFESFAALTSWVKEHLVYLWTAGDQLADCDDYASRLQLEAFNDGYLLSVQLIKDGMLNGKNVSNYLESHMGNLAMVGNEIYFIEPQPDYFRIVFAAYRD